MYPFKILKHIIKSPFKPLNSSDSRQSAHERSLHVKHFMLGNLLVKVRWTDSIKLYSIIPSEEGDQIEVQYCNNGRT